MDFLKYIFESADESIKVRDEISDDIRSYENTIVDNIGYDQKTNKPFYYEFESVEIKKIINKFKSDYGDDVIDQINLESFFRKINQILSIKSRSVKRKIREEFNIYVDSLDKRISSGDKENKEDFFDKIDGEYSIIPRRKYEGEKYQIQIELLKLQEWVVKNKKRVAIVFEGRDAAGKGSTIKRFVEYLNPKYFKVVALGVPTPEEKENWLGRYEKYLPKPGEIVFFDRSWYNRAVVEPAMGYCDEDQYTKFIEGVSKWEDGLIDSGLILIKFWFSISKEKQELRFRIRQNSPLKYWKFSPNDAKAIDKWDIITKYKKQMFSRTSSNKSPWVIVNSNDKKIGRLNAMRYVLSSIDYDDKNPDMSQYYSEVIYVVK